LVDDASAVPEDHFSSRDFLQILAEMAIRYEEDLEFGRHSANDGLSIAGSDDPIREGFDSCSAVDVGNGLEAPAINAKHFLIASELLGRATFGETASGLQIGQQNALIGIQDLCRLGHEMHAAENDRRRGNLRGLAS